MGHRERTAQREPRPIDDQDRDGRNPDADGRPERGHQREGQPGGGAGSRFAGFGQTTFCGKLAKYLKEQRKMNPLLVACDVYRPAAIDQLTVLAESIKVAIYTEVENKNPIEIAQCAGNSPKPN